MITIIGVPICGALSPEAVDALTQAELIIGGTRLLSRLDPLGLTGERFDLTGRMREVRPLLAARPDAAIAVLASGDPMFYGIGGFLAKHLSNLRVLPAPCSVAVAFARVGLAWEDALVLSAHGRPMPDVAEALDRAGKVAVLTDEKNTPAAIGALLGHREGQAWVAERLGEPEEAVHTMPISALAAFQADPLNVLILVGPRRARPVIPHGADEAFEKKMPRKGLITKREVRTLSLGALGLCRGDTCWDIGAGSGAVGIEMALLGAGAVWAVEKNEDGCAIIAANAASFGAPNVHIVHKKAPDGLEALPDPDRVFIGGSGGNMADLVSRCLERLRPGGRLVVNLATVENLAECLAAFKAAGVTWSLTQVSVARSSPILDLTRFEAQNPVWIAAADAAVAP